MEESGSIIVVVEDDLVTAETLRRVLKQIQPAAVIEVFATARGALEFIEKARTGTRAHVDLIVADISLPGDMNGTELWEVCRKQVPGVPVMLISGSPIELYRPFFQKYGVFPPFLRKPFSVRDFRDLYELLIHKEEAKAA